MQYAVGHAVCLAEICKAFPKKSCYLDGSIALKPAMTFQQNVASFTSKQP